MKACEIGFGMNIGECLHAMQQAALGWVPEWLWALLPYWPWLVVIGGAGMAYRFAGWPGVAAFFGGVGFIAGRRSVEKSQHHEHVTGVDANPPVAKPVKRRKIIFNPKGG